MTDDEIRKEGAKAIRGHMAVAHAQKVEAFCVATLKNMFDHIETASLLGCSSELAGVRKALSAYVDGARRAIRRQTEREP